MKLSEKQILSFQNKIWNFYKENKRVFSWRKTHDPYKILVSEIMLQQTQTSRVMEKYPAFLNVFPSVKELADSSQKAVLKVWQGLGYNRRSFYLKRTAEIIHATYHDKLPKEIDELIKLPGIGKNTAGALVAFAYNLPVVFIETNIRRVFIHEFFKGEQQVSDKDILEFVAITLDKRNPREWYYALMDYGVYLAKIVENPNKKSSHYKIQSKFEGSNRQVRGKIIRLLIARPFNYQELKETIASIHFEKALQELKNEGLIQQIGSEILLS